MKKIINLLLLFVISIMFIGCIHDNIYKINRKKLSKVDISRQFPITYWNGCPEYKFSSQVKDGIYKFYIYRDFREGFTADIVLAPEKMFNIACNENEKYRGDSKRLVGCYFPGLTLVYVNCTNRGIDGVKDTVAHELFHKDLFEITGNADGNHFNHLWIYFK